jgi:hypothetical protein
VIAVKGYKHLIDFETSSGNCTSRPREIVLVCLEMKMIGKPYAGELHVRFDAGEQDCASRMILYGHEAGNGGDSQEST